MQGLSEVAIYTLNAGLAAGIVHLRDHVCGLAWDVGVLLEGGENVRESLGQAAAVLDLGGHLPLLGCDALLEHLPEHDDLARLHVRPRQTKTGKLSLQHVADAR